MPLVRYCVCDHTDIAHNTKGCKRYDCPCSTYSEAEAVFKELTRNPNY